ncbi:hypothetical protein [Thermofilum pendens]|uniref:Uncharacterized protein n=1 Tax=Thermofilum pendens (strain DSM 2475 / Hrk 5) TaxID=368408 RepID=A1S080_THEPD|nr:hypothetical protein [Thermofilum pendens]ABL78860.1 hypothetical protein Tpen_1463 [Thermofilum pendens Hrk 5]
MDPAKALALFKYLVKNDVVNPLLKPFRRRMWVLKLLLAVLIALLVALVLLPKVGAPQKTGETSGAGQIRGFLRSLGLDKEKLIDILSALTLLYPLASIAFMRPLAPGRRDAVLIVREAEYELVLSQPVGMDTYIAGHALFDVAASALPIISLAGLIPLALDVSGGSAKAFLLPLSALLQVLFLSYLRLSVGVLRKALSSKGWTLPARSIAAAYAVGGVAHSLVEGRVSPLLSLPLRPVWECVIYPFTRAETVADLLLALAETALVTLLLFAAAVRLSVYVSPEDVLPLEYLFREASSRKGIARGPSLDFSSPESAVKSFVLRRSLLSPGHLKGFSVLLAASVAVALVAVRLLGPLKGEALMLVPVFLVYMAMIPLFGFLSQKLAEDVQAYWVYRVYSASMEHVAGALLVKYAVHMAEGALVVSAVHAVLAWSPLPLLLPLVAAPGFVVTGFLSLASTLYFASKRKVVRYSYGGTTVLEGLASGAVMVITIVFLILLELAFYLFTSLNAWSWASVLSAASVATSALLYALLKRALSEMAEEYDVAT